LYRRRAMSKMNWLSRAHKPKTPYQAIRIMFEIAPQGKVDNQIVRPFLLAVDVPRDTDFSPAWGPRQAGAASGR
jgi:hypothetical protein